MENEQKNNLKNKRKTIQFEDINKEMPEELKKSISPPTENKEKVGILKRKSAVPSQEFIIKENNSEIIDEISVDNGKIPLLN